MSFIQLQISRDQFLEIFRSGLRKQIPTLLDAEIPLPFTGTLLLDGVEVLPETLIDDTQQATAGIQFEERFSNAISADVPRNRYVAVQPLRLAPVLLTGEGTPTPVFQTLPQVGATLRVEFDAWSGADWIPRLFLTVQSFTLDPLPPLPGVDPTVLEAAKQQVEQQIRPLLGGSSQALLKDSLLGDNPWGRLDYINTGLAMDRELTRVVILMQSRPAPEFLVNAWRIFHARQLDDLLQSPDVRYHWAQTADSYILEQAVIYELEKFLNRSGSEIRATRNVQATWTNPGGGARISVFFPAETNAPDPFAGTIDFEIRSAIVFSAVPPDTLRTSMATLVVETGEPIGMSLAMVGFVLVGYSIPGIGVLTPLVLRLVCEGLINGMLDGVTLSPGSSLGMVCTESRVQNISSAGLTAFLQEATCEKAASMSFPVGGGRSIAMRLLEVRGLPKAMVLAGSFAMPDPVGHGFDIEVLDFRWSAHRFPCGVWVAGLPLGTFDTGEVTARAQIYLTPHRDETADIRSARIVSADPRGVVTNIAVQSRNVEIALKFDTDYLAAPYPFWVLLHTTGGVRLLQIAPPPAMSAAEAERLVRDALARSISDCYALSDPFYRLGNRIHPKWIPDPQPGLSGVRLLWVVRANGLVAGERVQVTVDDGTELSEVRASQRGVAPFAGLLPLDQGRSLGLQRLGEEFHSADLRDEFRKPERCCSKAQYLDIEQSVWVERARIGFGEPAGDFDLEHVGGMPALLVPTQSWLNIIDLSDPAAPRRSASFPVEGVRGAMAASGGVLVWGDGGLQHRRLVNLPGRREDEHCESPCRRISRNEVRRVCRNGGRYLVLNADRLELYDRDRECHSALLEGSWKDCAILAGHLFLLGEGIIEVFRLVGTDTPQTVALFEAPGASRLVTPAVGPVKAYLYAGLSQGGTLWDVNDPSAPGLVSRHEDDPFWAAARRSGSTMVLREDARTLSIHTLEQSARAF